MKFKKYRIIVTAPTSTLFYDTDKNEEADKIVEAARGSPDPLIITVYSKNKGNGYSKIFSKTNQHIGF